MPGPDKRGAYELVPLGEQARPKLPTQAAGAELSTSRRPSGRGVVCRFALLAVVALAVQFGLLPWLRDLRVRAVPLAGGVRATRVELRELSDEAWQELAAALWTMKSTPGDEGRRRFGRHFVSYDELVARHWDDVQHLRCGDNGLHHGVLFGVYHRLFTREFERALALLLPSSGAAYWDWTSDLVLPQRPPLLLREDANHSGLSNAFLGSATGDPKQDFSIADGVFRGWPVAQSADARHRNAHGWMRGGAVDSPLVVRFPAYCALDPAPLHEDELNMRSCLVAESFDAWSACAVALHNRVHRYLGGAVNCTSPTPLADANLTTGPNSLIGDFESAVSSVNDPAFFFIHSFFDRLLLEWQVLQQRDDWCADGTWEDIFDAVQAALSPCRHDGRWDEHRWASILFHKSSFRPLFHLAEVPFRYRNVTRCDDRRG